MAKILSLRLRNSVVDAINGYTTTITGTEQYTTGVKNESNGAFSFNNTNYIVLDADYPNFTSSDPFTINAWIKVSTGSTQMIVAKRSGPGYNFWVTNTGKLNFLVGNGTSTWIVDGGASVWADDTFHMVSAVYTGGGSPNQNGMKTYVDAVLNDTGLSGVISGDFTSTPNLTIGASVTGTNTMDSGSALSKVDMFDEALSVAELKAIYILDKAGIEFDTAEKWDPIRLNQKTRFVGTGEQATTFITDPQIGQMVYATESDATFPKEKLSVYDSSNTWVTPQYAESDESSNVFDTDGTGTTLPHRFYNFMTLPTDHKWYFITAIETVAGGYSDNTWNSGVDLIDAIPPVNTSTPLVALCPVVTKAFDDDCKIPVSWSKPIRGGTDIGVWIAVDSASAHGVYFDSNIQSSQNQQKDNAYTETPPMVHSGTWTASIGRVVCTVYYRGYS